ncbi:hypothetical protein [Variovorax sp. KK3]|uniref:hypothetical protein n=1 Tax=Variovorax sp. KK3 TaxID=1855728 RepID=UPI00097BFA83|nr:hypothetical protein [Variovorax sp. KK3]
MAARLASMPVRLSIPTSPYVPGGVSAETNFAALVPDHFRWRLTGMAVGDWWETLQCLQKLATPLRAAVDSNDAVATLAACESIAQWGADRNSRVGANAYLASLGDRLPEYLRRTGAAMRLACPDESGIFRVVPKMNSTLGKIHSLLALDGLPIYESRIAAAIAALVEIWRRETGRAGEPLPAFLRFPAVGGQLQRRLRRLYPDAVDPGLLSYSQGSEIATAGRWASATVRLGLLIGLVIRRCDPDLFVAWPDDPASRSRGLRMATFTAALFMAGYDPTCLLPAEFAADAPVRADA